MCVHCESLIEAIDRYLQKSDDDFKQTLEDEGRVLPDESIDAMNAIEDGITLALVAETDYFINEIKKKKSLSEIMDVLEEIKAKDAYCDAIREVVSEQFHSIVPELTKKYVNIVDPGIKITAISHRAYDWIDRWSGQLADLMKLTSHNEIETILKNGLEVGSDIESVTLDILNSGIRDEYYRARTVAVTEILRAHSVSKWEAAMQNPCINEKKWKHTGSYKNAPRENHVAMDGQVVPVNDPFVLVGADGNVYYPMFPLDPILPARESIHCHCLEQDIVDEDILAMSLEERQELQQRIIEEMDDAWEAELDAKNRAKAGIE